MLGIRQVVRGDFDGTDAPTWQEWGTRPRRVAPVRTVRPVDRSARADRNVARQRESCTPTRAPSATAATSRWATAAPARDRRREQSGNTLYTVPATGRAANCGRATPVPSATSTATGGATSPSGTTEAATTSPARRPSEVDGSLTVYPGDGGPRSAANSRGPRSRAAILHTARLRDGGPGRRDGRDGILLPTSDGVSLLEDLDGAGGSATMVRDWPRPGPRQEALRPAPPRPPVHGRGLRRRRPGRTGLNWSADPMYGYYGENPTHWWITDGVTARDRTAFDAPVPGWSGCEASAVRLRPTRPSRPRADEPAPTREEQRKRVTLRSASGADRRRGTARSARSPHRVTSRASQMAAAAGGALRTRSASRRHAAGTRTPSRPSSGSPNASAPPSDSPTWPIRCSPDEGLPLLAEAESRRPPSGSRSSWSGTT